MGKNPITISLVQAPVVAKDIAANLTIHLNYIAASSTLGADVVVFPELSLTGYELSDAQSLTFRQDPSDFSVLSNAAREHNITIIAGCPLAKYNSHPTIGAVICFPTGKVEFYSKQFLHQGEHSYCSFGATDYCFSVAGYRIALAICADFLTPEHSENAANNHADIYITSALISESGYEMDARVLAGIAVKHKMPVLLSNHISQTGGWLACGHSAAWNADGELIVSSEHKQRCLVLCTLANGSMTGAVSEMH